MSHTDRSVIENIKTQAYKKYAAPNSSPAITKRGVIWLGSYCDVRCIFCYDHGKNAVDWLPLDGNNSSKSLVEKMRFFYGNRYIDFMGGEPTLYPHISSLISYCNEIGIRPTIITNGRRLANIKVLRDYISFGLHDVLLSVNALENCYDNIVNANKSGGFRLLLQCLDNLASLNVPFRVNITMIDWNREALVDIARLVIGYGALVVNYIAFNPYFNWESNISIPFQVKHSLLEPYLREAIAVCNNAEREVNVRYFPFCQLKGLEMHVYNNSQLPYDQHEWDLNSWFDCKKINPDCEFYYQQACRVAKNNGYVHGEICQKCSLRMICDGLHSQYARRFDFYECNPYSDELVNDPKVFLVNQRKLVYLHE